MRPETLEELRGIIARMHFELVDTIHMADAHDLWDKEADRLEVLNDIHRLRSAYDALGGSIVDLAVTADNIARRWANA